MGCSTDVLANGCIMGSLGAVSLASGRIMGCTTDDEHDYNNDADDLIVTTIWISLDCES